MQDPRAEMFSGQIREMTIVAERTVALLSRITAEYYLLLLLGDEGILGQGRYELAKRPHRCEGELRLKHVVVQRDQGPDRPRRGAGALGARGRADRLPDPHRGGAPGAGQRRGSPAGRPGTHGARAGRDRGRPPGRDRVGEPPRHHLADRRDVLSLSLARVRSLRARSGRRSPRERSSASSNR